MTFTFGKYKGRDVEKVRVLDPGYLTWAYDVIGKRLDKKLYNYIDANLEEIKAEAELAQEEYNNNLRELQEDNDDSWSVGEDAER